LQATPYLGFVQSHGIVPSLFVLSQMCGVS